MKDTKMSFEEFKQVLNDAEIDLDVFGFEGILAMISNYQYRLYADCSQDPEMVNVADSYNKTCKVIWRALEQCGYFN